MSRKPIKVSRRMLVVWFLLAGFILLFAPQGITRPMQHVFANAFQLPLTLGRKITRASAPAEAPAPGSVARQKYDQLYNHMLNIMAQRDQVQRQVQSLARMRVVPGWERMSFLPAEVITSPQGVQETLFINRGADDGVAQGQFVLGDNSIIGVISDVSPNTARVRLVTDPTSTVAAKPLGLAAGRLMEGLGSGRAKIRLMKDEVSVGTHILASAKPGFLDCDMIAGVVTACERNATSPLLWDITVAPMCDIATLSTVAVVMIGAPQPVDEASEKK